MKQPKSFANQSGSVFIVLLVFATVFTILVIGTVQVVSHSAKLSGRNIQVRKSYWASEGAMRLGLRYLTRTRILADTLLQINGFFSVSSDSGATKANASTLNGHPVPPVLINTVGLGKHKNFNLACTTVAGQSGLGNCVTCAGISAINIEEYTFFSNTPLKNPKVWKDMVVYGNYHINGEARIDADMAPTPHVTGVLTTADNSIRDHFEEPYDMGIEVPDYLEWGSSKAAWTEALRRRIPAHADIGHISTNIVSPAGFTADMTIPGGCDNVKIVLDDTDFHVYRGKWSKGYTYVGSHSLAELPNGVLRVEDEVEIKGTLDGKLTVVSDYDIYIVQNILYANRNIVPGIEGVSDDVLALVSGGNIEIPIRTDDASGLTFQDSGAVICASLFAPNGRFGLHGKHLYPHVSDLRIYGSVLVNEQDPSMVYDHKKGHYQGMQTIAIQDPRFAAHVVSPPGIGAACIRDRDFPLDEVYAWMLCRGEWENKIVRY